MNDARTDVFAVGGWRGVRWVVLLSRVRRVGLLPFRVAAAQFPHLY